jgi:hypothetical protein
MSASKPPLVAKNWAKNTSAPKELTGRSGANCARKRPPGVSTINGSASSFGTHAGTG